MHGKAQTMSQGSSTGSLGVTLQMEDDIFVFHCADPQNEDPVRPDEKQSVLFQFVLLKPGQRGSKSDYIP